MVLILQWKMVKFTGRSALVANQTTIAKASKTFLSKTVYPTLFTNLVSQVGVTSVTVVQTERQEEKKVIKQMKQQQHGYVLYLSTCNRFSGKRRKFANKKPILTQLIFCC